MEPPALMEPAALARPASSLDANGTRRGDLGVEPFQTRLAHGLGELALPDDDDMPSGGFERGVLRDVAVMVAGQFRGPEFHVGFGNGILGTSLMRMPEASVDEHDRMPSGQNHVGMAGIAPVVFAEPKPPREQVPAHEYFDAGVLPADMRHRVAARAPLIPFAGLGLRARFAGSTGLPRGLSLGLPRSRHLIAGAFRRLPPLVMVYALFAHGLHYPPLPTSERQSR